MRPLPVLCLVLAALLAGCADAPADDGDDTADPDTATMGGEDGDTSVDFSQGMPVPVWNVGDWWQYKVQYTSGESFDTKLIVYADDGDTYRISAEDRGLILRSQFQHYPNFGPIRKSDLGQQIHGVDAPDLRFPMTNGTWSGPYREFTATWNTSYAMLETPKGTVPGFRTTMVDDRDGLVRIAHSWSPVAKWFTAYTFDFDGNDPVDVTITLQDWGTRYTGTFPIVTIVDGVHRPFPTLTVAPPDAASPPGPSPFPPTETFTVSEGDGSVLWAMFAGAGGPGRFQAAVSPPEGGQPTPIEWQPSAGGGHFSWGEITAAAAGEWTVAGQGVAQGFAFMFLETYEAHTTEGRLTSA